MFPISVSTYFHECSSLIFFGGEAYPLRTWLTSWNRAIQIQYRYSSKEFQG